MSFEGFERAKLAKLFSRSLIGIPDNYISADTARVTLVYFAVSGLDLLMSLPAVPNSEGIIRWIYSLQIISSDARRAAVGATGASASAEGASGSVALADESYPDAWCGFLGSSAGGRKFSDGVPSPPNGAHDAAHITATYAALATLTVLGDDLSRVDRAGIIRGLKCLQDPSGGFAAVAAEGEVDMRFLYCACAISTLLNDWSAVNRSAALDFIRGSLTYEGAFGLYPGLEAHGGSTYCALASLSLMAALDDVITPSIRADLLRWLTQRQVSGFQGRPNKDPDSCYSFWIGGSLAVLGCADVICKDTLFAFLMECQHPAYGGIAKCPGEPPDLLHCYLGLSGLSFIGHDDVADIDPALGITLRAKSTLTRFETPSDTLTLC